MLIPLTAIALVSISLFEALLVILLLYMLYKTARDRAKWSGLLLKPLLLHAFVVLSSTLLYHPSQLVKAIERGLFLLVYPLGERLKVDRESLYKFNLFLLLSGLALIPLVLYKTYKTGQPAMLWGGWFEVGAFYVTFAVSSLSMTFYTRRWIYFIPSIFFAGMVFFTTRRSAMLGLIFSVLVIVLLIGRRASKRTVLLSLLVLFLGVSVSTAILIQKDPRYKTAYEVVIGKRPINDETLNAILSYRWEIAKAGLEVVKKDIKEGNILPMLIGHGINSGFYLEPKSPVGGIYESFFILSEFIEKGLLGTLAVLWVFYAYFKFLFRFKVANREDFLLLPLILALGSHLVGSVFTFFWDALLPLYLLFFRVVERLKSEPPYDEPFL